MKQIVMGAAWFVVFAVVTPLGLAAAIGIGVGIANHGEDRIMLDAVQRHSLGLIVIGILLAALMAIIGTKFRKLSGTELGNQGISISGVEWKTPSVSQPLNNTSASNAVPDQWWFVCFIAAGAMLSCLPIQMLFFIGLIQLPIALGLLIFSQQRIRLAVLGLFVGLFVGIGYWMMFGID